MTAGGGTEMAYPSWPGRYQMNDGDLPSMYNIGPPDLHPSGHNPYYDVYSATRGRQLGDVSVQSHTDNADSGAVYNNSLVGQMKAAVNENEMQDYPVVLDDLQAQDDVQGNGIFDPHGTHGNINPDAGIFADREALPGYVAREQFFKPSEVIDVNSGRPVVYVPGNAFMLDPRTDETLRQRNLYEPGLPTTGGQETPMASTWIPNDPTWGVGVVEPGNGAEAPRSAASGAKMFIAAGVAGLAIGLAVGMFRKKKK